MQHWHDCSCEDFPCCGHYDTLDAAPEFCDYCGMHHAATFDCSYDGDEGEDEDDCDCGNDNCMMCNGDKERNESRQRYNAFGQALRAGAPELPGDNYGDTPFHEEDYE